MNTMAVVLVSYLAAPSAFATVDPKDAEEQGTPAAEVAGLNKKTVIPLRLALTVSRYDGEKKVGSLPYVLQVAANDSLGVKLRMGVEVPVPVTSIATTPAGAGAAPTTSYQYRNVGANIDCRADSLEDGRFRLALTFEQSSLPPSPEGKPTPPLPLFRTFMSSVTLVLRDGQTTQYVAATDSVTGESTRIDATLTVAK